MINWIDRILTEVDHVETPRSWIWWSLCCSISAAAGNNYFLKTLKGAVIYKPNLYVILLGESGLGKGFPVHLSKTLVQKANCTRVIAGRSSIQAIVKELSLAKTRPDQEPILDSRGFIVNGELSTAIIQDPDSLTILTDLYDGHYNPEWSNLLKGDGAEKLKEPYITALFGSSPAHFYDSIPTVNIEGGYLGRNLIIFEEKRYKDSNLLDEEDEGIPDFPFEEYAKHLKYIALKSGRMIPNFDAKQAFNSWRKTWREKQQADKTGFLNRIPDHALKVAMCLALAEPELSNLVIREEHIEEAIDKVTSLQYANKMTSEGKGIDPLAAQTKLVLDLLLKEPSHELMRKQLIQRGYGVYDAFTLDKVLETLQEAGWVEKERYVAGKNSDWSLKLTGEPLEQYQKFKAARDKRKEAK